MNARGHDGKSVKRSHHGNFASSTPCKKYYSFLIFAFFYYHFNCFRPYILRGLRSIFKTKSLNIIYPISMMPSLKWESNLTAEIERHILLIKLRRVSQSFPYEVKRRQPGGFQASKRRMPPGFPFYVSKTRWLQAGHVKMWLPKRRTFPRASSRRQMKNQEAKDIKWETNFTGLQRRRQI